MHKNLEQHLPFLIEELSNKDSADSIDVRWHTILGQFFNTSELTRKPGAIEHSKICNGNSTLLAPAIEGNQHYELIADQPEQFSENDQHLADAMFKLCCQFISIQQAVEIGATEERQRIARDLHDDVAARLLTLIHQAKDQQSIDLARSILKSLRNAIYTLDNKSTTTILDALTDIRAEIQDRLNSIGILLYWEQHSRFDKLTFTPRQHINLHRIAHEIATNAIRHANAQYMSIDVDLEDTIFHITVCDNGPGFNIDECIPGKGINNIKTRVKELYGQVNWTTLTETNDNKGCCIDIQFPISLATE
ncbi:MAG: hypothetical protein OQL06_06815 [Gammaproteobacteria bacterium]|nr:hypothetical protein [Gammaproteobacteria bacterium]